MSGLEALSLNAPSVVVPADVRKAGADAEKTYRAALGFERTLLGELTKTMAKDTSRADGEDGDGGADAATAAYRDMLPGTLADAVAGAGGLGLAHDLYLSMRSRA